MKILRFCLVVLWAGLASIHSAGLPVETRLVEHSEKTGVASQPELRFFLRLPEGHSPDKPLARGVLAICTFLAEDESLRRLVRDDNADLVRYARRNQLALLTWNTATLWQTGKSFDQITREERRAQDATFDDVARAWDRGVRELCRENGLPQTGFLMYGLSRGAHWGGRLALRVPERFLAVHIHVANSYEKAVGSAVGPLWMISSGDLDIGRDNALAFYRLCESKGYPIVFKVANGLGHADSPEIQKLAVAFFDYARHVAKRAGAERPTDVMLRDLTSSGLTGDLLTQEVYRGSAADIVPTSQRVPLPDEAVARAWGFLRK